MRKLNNKNKFFILLFSLVIVVITVLLVYSISLSGTYDNLTSVKDISTNSVVYDQSDYLINTKSGGNLKRSWDANYYYVDYEDNSHLLGDRAVIYEKAVEEVYIYGDNHYVSPNGNVTKNNDETSIRDVNNASFYKLGDRAYLIIAKEIYNDDKSIFTSKYLIVLILITSFNNEAFPCLSILTIKYLLVYIVLSSVYISFAIIKYALSSNL